MELVIGCVLFALGLVVSVFKDIYMGYSLTFSLFVFMWVAFKMGKDARDIKDSVLGGMKKSFGVLKIFILIGMVTSSWLAAGTIPSIVYYSLKLISPRYFVLLSFFISSIVSYMLGTSFGTVSTIGIVLMIMARTGDINLNLVGGAILSGCYFGDRTSPMSSSVNLVSTLTGSELYKMLEGFRRTTVLPFIVTSAIYLIFSILNPLEGIESMMASEIKSHFRVSFIILIPAITMLGLSVLKVNVHKAMGISIILGSMIAVFIQKMPFLELFKSVILGFDLGTTEPIAEILKGGGVLSMAGSGYVIFISCGLVGVFEEVHLFDKIHDFLNKIVNRDNMMILTAGTATLTAMVGGNQVISIIMTIQIMKDLYEKYNFTSYDLAIDVSNTAILFAGLIPWNIASIVPATAMGLNPIDIAPYAFYLYLSFIINRVVHIKRS